MTRRLDLTDEQWARLEPLLPVPTRSGRPSAWTKRQLIDGIRWRVRVGAPWRDVPDCYGSWRAAVRGASVTVELALGVDSSVAMIQQARTLAAARPRAAFVVADAQQLPFPAATFSAVLCSTALRHFTDAGAAAAEMARVLTPAGRMVIADFPVRGAQRARGWWRSAHT